MFHHFSLFAGYCSWPFCSFMLLPSLALHLLHLCCFCTTLNLSARNVWRSEEHCSSFRMTISVHSKIIRVKWMNLRVKCAVRVALSERQLGFVPGCLFNPVSHIESYRYLSNLVKHCQSINGRPLSQQQQRSSLPPRRLIPGAASPNLLQEYTTRLGWRLHLQHWLASILYWIARDGSISGSKHVPLTSSHAPRLTVDPCAALFTCIVPGQQHYRFYTWEESCKTCPHGVWCWERSLTWEPKLNKIIGFWWFLESNRQPLLRHKTPSLSCTNGPWLPSKSPSFDISSKSSGLVWIRGRYLFQFPKSWRRMSNGSLFKFDNSKQFIDASTVQFVWWGLHPKISRDQAEPPLRSSFSHGHVCSQPHN